jgi:hypothetical protein
MKILLTPNCCRTAMVSYVALDMFHDMLGSGRIGNRLVACTSSSCAVNAVMHSVTCTVTVVLVDESFARSVVDAHSSDRSNVVTESASVALTMI